MVVKNVRRENILKTMRNNRIVKVTLRKGLEDETK